MQKTDGSTHVVVTAEVPVSCKTEYPQTGGNVHHAPKRRRHYITDVVNWRLFISLLVFIRI